MDPIQIEIKDVVYEISIVVKYGIEQLKITLKGNKRLRVTHDSASTIRIDAVK